MDNDAKHALVKTLKWYRSCEIKIEAGPPHPPDIKSIENVWGIINKAQET